MAIVQTRFFPIKALINFHIMFLFPISFHSLSSESFSSTQLINQTNSLPQYSLLYSRLTWLLLYNYILYEPANGVDLF